MIGQLVSELFKKYFIPNLAWKIFKSNDICSHIQSLLNVEFDINGPLIAVKMSMLKCQRSIMAFCGQTMTFVVTKCHYHIKLTR